MDSPREVVVTGVGVVCPIGIGKQQYWDALINGQSGVGPITKFDASCLPVQFGGEVRDFDNKLYIKPRKAIKTMCREIQTGFAAASLAIDDGGLDTDRVDSDRFGAGIGCDMLYGDVHELDELYRTCITDGTFHYERFADRMESRLNPLWLLKHLPNMAACHVGIAFDARGPNNSVVQGDVSGLLAVAECTSVIARGNADVMIAGGTGARLNLTAVMFRSDSNLSHRGHDPPGACRPFERDRDGMVNGEGAAAFLLESMDHARARGATILARIAGYGCAFGGLLNDDKHCEEGIRRSIDLAMRSARLSASDLGHVNANGVSTVESDEIEARAISQTVGEVPVTAPKSFFGNLGGGTAAAEMVASVLAIQHGKIPFTLNYENPDPRCPIHVVRDNLLRTSKRNALVLSQSSMGPCVAMVLSAD